MGSIRNSDLDSQEVEGLKLTQSIISRMAANSEKTKTVFISLSGGLAALSGINASAPSWKVLACFCFISITLWYIDACYLRLERLFRIHHRKIVGGTISCLQRYLMNVSDYEHEVDTRFKTMFSSFSLILYPAVILVMLIFSIH